MHNDQINDWAERLALHRFGVICEATNERLSHQERGVIVREIATRSHAHPDGSDHCYARATIDRWIRAWRGGGLDGLKPKARADSGVVRNHPECYEEMKALRLELPSRSAAQIAQILLHRNGIVIAERTVRDQLHRAGLARGALAAEQRAFGRYEADHANDRWITDVLIDPWVPFPKTRDSVRAKLFLIVDDHSRLIVGGRFFTHENARSCQELLAETIIHRGLPTALYCDNGAPFSNMWLTRTLAVLGVRLIHSKPYSPQGRGKQERANRYIREAFLAEATHQGIDSLAELNDRFVAWAEQVANRRIHKETKERPIDRFCADGPHRQVDLERLKEAFRWSVTRKVTKTATVSLEGNAYEVDTSLVGRRIELRYRPEDLSRIDVFYEGRPVGAATPFVISRHTHRAVPQASQPTPAPTGVDYLGLVQAAHEAEAGTDEPLRFSSPGLFDAGLFDAGLFDAVLFDAIEDNAVEDNR